MAIIMTIEFHFSFIQFQTFLASITYYCLLFLGCDLVATTIGTAVAFLLVPMRSLGQDGWKIAAALMGRHIGGGNIWRSINFCDLVVYLFNRLIQSDNNCMAAYN